LLPPDLKMDYIANQPQVVEERMSGMGHEFLIAITCVVIVTVLLLPMRVALIAALAIPITMLATIGVMNAFGVQLHQVSIAALILVLGIVVDDAIVIADNYVELLDHKVARAEAAWRGPLDVLVPVLVATLTIVASFLPLVILSGSAGEFILALPLTVAVALSVSFLVAIFLTPLLCRTFIAKGLHDHDAEPSEGVKKFNLLDALQVAYKKAITYFMGRPRLAVGLGVVAVAAGGLMFHFIPEQFFPNAERNQFVIDLWLPQGSRIEATDRAMRAIEKELGQDKDVVHYASFVGQSAPRFYYNVNPQQPDASYGQFIVNTRSAKATVPLVSSLQGRLSRLVPEGMVIVKELQQGASMEAPVEVRISGDDVDQLKNLGRQVEDILRADKNARYVHTDFFNDSALANVTLNTELASRLGMTYSGVSKLLSGAFDGTPVSTFWEGNRAVNILLRVDPAHRGSFDDVRDTYVGSSLAPGKVPLRSIAEMTPDWQTSRIVRRNGVPTLTVRAFHAPGTYASGILGKALPKVKAIPLPPGYQINLGGEWDNRHETFPEMVTALSISLLAIFLILMLQFRNLTEPLVVMTSIPLSLFGVAVGLVLTRNAFGFTAFMGMISLCGIVVRNAIILIDFIKEKLSEGLPLEEAATQAGERRLRPIFLTTMAAAVGVTPMILSGSKLWSPLASVLAVGLIFSMFFTLLVVPVIYVLLYRRHLAPRGAAAVLLLGALCLPLSSAEPQHLTVDEAIRRALQHSSGVRIAQAKVEEAQAKRRTARADYLPQLKAEATWMKTSGEQLIQIPAGSLGTIPGLGPFPMHDMGIGQGDRNLYLQDITLGQPLTQLFKIYHGNQVASAEERVAQAELRKMEGDIAFKTRQVYAGLLIAQARQEAAKVGVLAAEQQDREAREAVQAGNVLKVVQTGSRTQLLQNRQRELAAEASLLDLRAELNDLMGQAIDAPLELASIQPKSAAVPPRSELLNVALAQNPDLTVAQETLEKSRSAVKAGRSDYLPEISAFARHIHQSGVPFLRTNSMSYGLSLSWTVFDWGKKTNVVSQRAALGAQASENHRRIRTRVEMDLDRLLRKLDTAKLQVEVAEEAQALHAEKARLAANQLDVGLVSAPKRSEADAAAKAADADLLAARLALDLTWAELDQLLGRH
ncbi:MAG: efflux RND transporter permease subunit, partial [Firmicutes bacterium]|nr:efflux RND transporter permease subunit [Bacillota bacterium]